MQRHTKEVAALESLRNAMLQDISTSTSFAALQAIPNPNPNYNPNSITLIITLIITPINPNYNPNYNPNA